jgi:hypothetical protein
VCGVPYGMNGRIVVSGWIVGGISHSKFSSKFCRSSFRMALRKSFQNSKNLNFQISNLSSHLKYSTCFPTVFRMGTTSLLHV